MTIDERLDRIQERTNATLERIAAVQRKTDERLDQLTERVSGSSLSTRVDADIAVLTQLLVSHNERRDKLEGH